MTIILHLMKYRTLFFLLAWSAGPACLLPTATEASTTVTLQPDGTTPGDGDSFVTTGPANNLSGNNYGAAGALEVSAAGMAKGEFKSVLRFDSSAAVTTFNGAYGAGGWTIDSIVLQLTVANPNNAIFNSPNAAGSMLVQWLQSDAWTEGTGTPASATTTGITWSQLATLLGSGVESEGTFAYNGEAVGALLQFTLTPSSGLLNDLLAGSQASLVLSATTSGMTALFNSRNNGVAGSRPALIVTASATSVPEPSRAMLMLAGLAVAFTQRRRRA